RPKWPGHYQPRVPMWGYENEADPKVMEKKIEAASAHGVNVFIFDWYWYGGRPFLEDALARGFLGAKNNGKMRFFLMWANHDFSDGCNNKVSRRNDRVRLRGGVNPEEFRAMTKRAIGLFLSRPNYYRIGGKPVFMIYEATTFVQGMGGMENAAAALRRFDEDCKAAGLGGVHLMACSWGRCRPEHVAALGFESATMYTYAHHVRPVGDYAAWAAKGLAKLDSEKARLKGLKAYFAHASIGWDTNPRYPETIRDVVTSTPESFEKALRDAKDWCDRNTPPGYPKLISINAWNEWIEGSYLEPDEKHGMGYLEAVRRVFCPQPSAPLKFLSFNIWGDYFENPVEEREAGVEATILKGRPDVVSLQEVTPGWYASPMFAHLKQAGYAVVRGDEDAALKRAAFSGEKTPKHINHEPLLYRTDRLNLLDSGTDFFHLSLTASKSATWAVLERKSDGRRFVAFATHFWWRSNGAESNAIRELNARHVLWLLADIRRKWGADLPAILGGDLNSTESSFAHAMLRSGGFVNAASNADVRSPYCSHHGNPVRGADGKYHGARRAVAFDKPDYSIDHIFYTKGIHALRHEIITDQTALDVSDHSPVLVAFELVADDIYVVVGYRKEQFKPLPKKYPNVSLIENPDYCT
ncbi:MAG: glycoside hydrolase family 99-like domain-containing protein, partial [Kiritimatiellae bacterium]|nr:glycoside hydrolase family 99-like domain-containing protein [Kiritimatiellia bacterium]